MQNLQVMLCIDAFTSKPKTTQKYHATWNFSATERNWHYLPYRYMTTYKYTHKSHVIPPFKFRHQKIGIDVIPRCICTAIHGTQTNSSLKINFTNNQLSQNKFVESASFYRSYLIIK